MIVKIVKKKYICDFLWCCCGQRGVSSFSDSSLVRLIFLKIYRPLWRRQWHPTPVFLPGESQGQGSLVGCCLWGRTEADMTEVT